MKLTKRKGFNFFRSYYDVYNELESDRDKVAFMDALLDRQFLGVKPSNLKGMSKFAYISQTNSIDSQVKGYEDKTGVKLTPIRRVDEPPCLGVEEPPCLQVQVEVQEKGKVEVQEKVEEEEKEEVKHKAETIVSEIDIYPTFDDFWDLYDKKIGKKDKIQKKWNKLKQAEKEKIINFIPYYKKSQPEKRFRKNPETFLNNESWNDELINNKKNGEQKSITETASTAFNSEIGKNFRFS